MLKIIFYIFCWPFYLIYYFVKISIKLIIGLINIISQKAHSSSFSYSKFNKSQKITETDKIPNTFNEANLKSFEFENRNTFDASKYANYYSKDNDPLLDEIVSMIVELGQVSTPLIQRRFGVGYARSARIIDQLEQKGIVSKFDGANPRRVLISKEDWNELQKHPNIQSRMTYEEIKEKFPSEYPSSILCIDSMDGENFEQYCVKLLEANGFEDVKNTQYVGDYGIDILAQKDGVTYAIQCKCYSSTVGNKAVQEAYSGKTFYNCMVGVVLTNNYFTNSAKETAEKTNILLWDRDKLIEYMNKLPQNY